MKHCAHTVTDIHEHICSNSISASPASSEQLHSFCKTASISDPSLTFLRSGEICIHLLAKLYYVHSLFVFSTNHGSSPYYVRRKAVIVSLTFPCLCWPSAMAGRSRFSRCFFSHNHISYHRLLLRQKAAAAHNKIH